MSVALVASVALAGLGPPQARGRDEAGGRGVQAREGALEFRCSRPGPCEFAFPMVRAGAPPSEVTERRLREQFRQRRQDASDEYLESLALVRWVGGSQRASGPGGVRVLDRARVQPGFHLVTSAHGPEALLLDEEGRLVHRWRRSFDQIFPQWANPRNPRADFWRRVHLLDDGGLIVLLEDAALVRLDRDSHVVWTRALPVHDDLDVTDDGRVLAIARSEVVLDHLLVADLPNAVEHVVVLDLEGEPIERLSLVDAMVGTSSWRQATGKLRRGGDSFHTASVQAWAGGPAPAAALAIVSNRHLGTVAALDLGSTRVRWSRTGPWEFASDARMLDTGRLLVLDNGSPARGRTRVIEVDASGAVVWEWAPDEPLFAGCCGRVRRLPGGNTLVTLGEAGVAFEVAPDGAVVWELRSQWTPADGVVPTLFAVERVGPERLGWLPGSPGG